MSKQKVVVCTKGKACSKRGAKEVFCRMEEMVENLGLEKSISLKKSDCLGQCGRGPVIKVKSPEKFWLGGIEKSDVRELIWSLVSGKPLKRFKLKKTG
jgi:(2Fe-2S) ferredoxin